MVSNGTICVFVIFSPEHGHVLPKGPFSQIITSGLPYSVAPQYRHYPFKAFIVIVFHSIVFILVLQLCALYILHILTIFVRKIA